VLAVYVASLLFGGVLITATLLGGAGHAGDLHGGGDVGSGAAGTDADHGGSSGHAWLSLFGLRFWSFGAAFFGLTGLVVGAVGGAAGAALAPWLSAGAGVAAGLGASAAFRALGRDAGGEVAAAAALVGREGRLLLPVDGARSQRGKVRLALPAGGQVDLVAESAEDDPLPAGAEVLVVEIRENVAVVARAPAQLPARR